MELSKVLEGFTVSNTLVIKAQVQVIRCGCRQGRPVYSMYCQCADPRARPQQMLLPRAFFACCTGTLAWCAPLLSVSCRSHNTLNEGC